MGARNEHEARTARTAALVEQLLALVQELEEMHPGRRFPLDGHLVGSIGEAAAEAMFALKLVTASTAGYDAIADDGRKVEIKATFGAQSVAIRATSGEHAGSALIVLRLSKLPDVAHEVVYNGPLAPALQIAGATRNNGQADMRLTRLRVLSQSVPKEERVARRDPRPSPTSPAWHGGSKRDPEWVLTSVTVATPTPRESAEFYARLLRVDVAVSECFTSLTPTYAPAAQLKGGRLTLNFEYERYWTPIVWPAEKGRQTSTQHLDIHVDDLDAAAAWAVSCGARAAGHQPQDNVRVMLDPVGHPFCLFN